MKETDIKRIFTVSPNRLGDTVFCTPVFRLLKEIYPQAKIDVVALTQLAADVLANNPYIDHVFLRPSMDHINKIVNFYDLAINMHESPAAREILNCFSCKLLVYDMHAYSDMHQTDKLLKFFADNVKYDLSKFNAHYDLYPEAMHIERMNQLLLENNIDLGKDILIGYQLGCHGLAKKRTRIFNRFAHPKAWPLKNFIKLMRELKKWNPHLRAVLTGVENEGELGKEFCKKFPDTINLINQTSVLELMALMSRLKLMITNDTGTLHVACASELPVIALFGKKNFVENGPYPARDDRKVFYQSDLADIKVLDVFQAACQFLSPPG
ncbi:MAG: hypothetical protein A3C55_05700 [Gammaproteobacteria bacterium RIFCSPHIGHO2_02_FULL_42_13]|nr:MAG: hypothetical protein A3C55_05700 [Gammaproteobacteria bacterium RIFCSPHIGHO2_02_FULL_42_13]